MVAKACIRITNFRWLLCYSATGLEYGLLCTGLHVRTYVRGSCEPLGAEWNDRQIVHCRWRRWYRYPLARLKTQLFAACNESIVRHRWSRGQLDVDDPFVSFFKRPKGLADKIQRWNRIPGRVESPQESFGSIAIPNNFKVSRPIVDIVCRCGTQSDGFPIHVYHRPGRVGSNRHPLPHTACHRARRQPCQGQHGDS